MVMAYCLEVETYMHDIRDVDVDVDVDVGI